MEARSKRRYTPEEYLVRERQAETKSQYYGGEIFAMSGASREHNLIVGNLVRALGNRLAKTPCEVYPSDMRIKVSASGPYTYPDVSVACADREFEDQHVDTLLNPAVVFEVLSDSTEAYDRGVKSQHYRTVDGLQEYVLVAQDRPSVEVYRRDVDGTWKLTEGTALESAVRLTSIDCELPLTEIYERLEFEPEDS